MSLGPRARVGLCGSTLCPRQRPEKGLFEPWAFIKCLLCASGQRASPLFSASPPLQLLPTPNSRRHPVTDGERGPSYDRQADDQSSPGRLSVRKRLVGPFAPWRGPERTDRRHLWNRNPARPGEHALGASTCTRLLRPGWGRDGPGRRHRPGRVLGLEVPRKAQEHAAEHVSCERPDSQ